ncbi:hypothetical protein IV203_022080 [Nitzschia inconspicua]|uniref:Uncharacterized protein n=1 Tax=Nitzschia inconspicua TaxID=303405 RepID=A0A9K3KHV7_9STRA|nr:hypothetical protein IV203_022080 [Nitzschia inconspicua]
MQCFLSTTLGNPLQPTADAIRALKGEEWLSTILIDHLLQTTLKGCVPDHVLIGSSDCYEYFNTYNDKLDKHDCADTVQTMRGGLQAYAKSEFRRRATAVLGRLQRFLFGFCFHGLDHNILLLEKQEYIVQQAVFRNCPKQSNSHDCGLFAVAVIWHLLDGKEVHSLVFTQGEIATLRQALYRGLSANAEWATLENVSLFFPALLPSLRNESSPAEDGELVDETCQEDEGPNEDEELVARTRPENSIHDVEDELFEKQIAGPSQVFQTVEELMVVINAYQETSGNSLAIRRSRGSSRAFACISHANFIKQLASDVALHKHAPPTANDVIKAGVHKKKTLLSYKQCYGGVNARKESKIISDSMSFQLVGPYVQTFAEQNPGSTAFMERGSNNRIQRVFVCPSFANDVLMCVRPVISIDAAHMRSEWKGTLYLATVKSALDNLYPVAFAITVDGEDLQSWLWFLEHLKASAPNLITEHFRRECSYKLFTSSSEFFSSSSEFFSSSSEFFSSLYLGIHIRRGISPAYEKFGATAFFT